MKYGRREVYPFNQRIDLRVPHLAKFAAAYTAAAIAYPSVSQCLTPAIFAMGLNAVGLWDIWKWSIRACHATKNHVLLSNAVRRSGKWAEKRKLSVKAAK